jgi:hypothetical protein
VKTGKNCKKTQSISLFNFHLKTAFFRLANGKRRDKVNFLLFENNCLLKLLGFVYFIW